MTSVMPVECNRTVKTNVQTPFWLTVCQNKRYTDSVSDNKSSTYTFEIQFIRSFQWSKLINCRFAVVRSHISKQIFEVAILKSGFEVYHEFTDGISLMPWQDTGFTSPSSRLFFNKLNRPMFVFVG